MKLATAICLGTLALAACHDKRPAEGPAQYTGRKVDESAHATKEGAKDVGHDTKCAAKNAKDDAQKKPRDPECY